MPGRRPRRGGPSGPGGGHDGRRPGPHRRLPGRAGPPAAPVVGSAAPARPARRARAGTASLDDVRLSGAFHRADDVPRGRSRHPVRPRRPAGRAATGDGRLAARRRRPPRGGGRHGVRPQHLPPHAGSVGPGGGRRGARGPGRRRGVLGCRRGGRGADPPLRRPARPADRARRRPRRRRVPPGTGSPDRPARDDGRRRPRGPARRGGARRHGPPCGGPAAGGGRRRGTAGPPRPAVPPGAPAGGRRAAPVRSPRDAGRGGVAGRAHPGGAPARRLRGHGGRGRP
ncbi:hypothetical protein CMsap09_12215 [Clavibacter michiganensis]|uniref:Uncharacterized protein n=1 Tax=Clavibacter michiganensis TaxID=28447 RepID=A0A251XVV4_9MICO|nr:hypothetical protein CMsap09_12215 [Clavibacter michiganensis]